MHAGLGEVGVRVGLQGTPQKTAARRDMVGLPDAFLPSSFSFRGASYCTVRSVVIWCCGVGFPWVPQPV